MSNDPQHTTGTLPGQTDNAQTTDYNAGARGPISNVRFDEKKNKTFRRTRLLWDNDSKPVNPDLQLTDFFDDQDRGGCDVFLSCLPSQFELVAKAMPERQNDADKIGMWLPSRVYFHKMCSQTERPDLDQVFKRLDALRTSKTVVPLMSEDFFAAIQHQSNDGCDYLLLEHWAMLELHDLKTGDTKNIDVGICPSNFEGADMKQVMSRMSDEVHSATQTVLKQYFNSRSLGQPKQLQLTPKDIIQRLLEFAGVNEARKPNMPRPVLDQIQRVCNGFLKSIAAKSTCTGTRKNLEATLADAPAGVGERHDQANTTRTNETPDSNTRPVTNEELAQATRQLSEEIRLTITEQGEATRHFMVELENVKVPYLFEIVATTANGGGARNDSPDKGIPVQRGRTLFERAHAWLCDPVKAASTFVKDNAESKGELRLLCGITLEPTVTYEIVCINERVAKWADLGSRMMRRALLVAACWNCAATGISCFFGVPVPQISPDRAKDARAFLDELKEGSSPTPLDDAQMAITNGGMDLEEMDEFGKYLEWLDKEHKKRCTNWKNWNEKLFRMEDPKRRGCLTYVSSTEHKRYGGGQTPTDAQEPENERAEAQRQPSQDSEQKSPCCMIL